MRQPLPALMTQRARRRRRAGCIPSTQVVPLAPSRVQVAAHNNEAHSIVDREHFLRTFSVHARSSDSLHSRNESGWSVNKYSDVHASA